MFNEFINVSLLALEEEKKSAKFSNYTISYSFTNILSNSFCGYKIYISSYEV